MTTTPWILLRGLTREAAHWGGFPAVFQRAMPTARIVTPDLPGNGQRHREASPATVAGMVAACRAEVARQGIAPPVHLLAMSLGAMVAAEWARVAPAEVAACVLINTSFRPFSPLRQRLLAHNAPTLLRLAFAPGSAQDAERAILRMTSNRVQAHEPVLQDWVAARAQRPVSAANALRQLVAAARFSAAPAAPIPKVLLLASEHDHLVDSRCSRAIASAWHCPLVMHPSAGHDLPLDDPAWVADQVRRWWQGPPDAPGA